VDDLKVRDIMQTEVITVGPDTSVRELADLLAEKKISGVPVVDGQGNLLGVVSEADIIVQDAELHFPYYIQFLDSIIYLQSFHKFEERFKKAFATKVGEIMTREVVVVSPETSVRAAATLMTDRNVNRLPVTESGKSGERLLGIVTRGDIVRAIAERE